jgi:hypothetical protein
MRPSGRTRSAAPGARPKAVAARYDRRIGRVVIRLSSGLEVAFTPHDAQGLENAKPAQLDEIEISPSGCGIHFPRIDADIYLPSLLEGLPQLPAVDGGPSPYCGHPANHRRKTCRTAPRRQGR